MGVVGVDSALVEGWSSKFRGRLGSRFGSGWILWPVSPDPSWAARRSQRGRQAVPFLDTAITLADVFSAPLTTIENGGHFLESDGYLDFSQLWQHITQWLRNL